jgi:hypothetical protein
MALAFPLSLANFFNLIPKVEATFDLDEAIMGNRTGGGEIITSSIGTRLWGGRITGNGYSCQNRPDPAPPFETLHVR